MATQKTLFTNVIDFYNNLLDEIETADHVISMMYYAFDHGEWAEKISKVLTAKASCGVRVRLMIDGIGQVLDNASHTLKNRTLVRELQKFGVDVEIFDPSRNHLTKLNRLHCKICAIDERVVFLGGSNIGDYYPTWDDTNLRLDGNLGNTFHEIFDFVRHFSRGQNPISSPYLDLSDLNVEDAQVLLTIPKQRRDIRRALLKLILDADKSIYIRTWYFLPDQEILGALRFQAEKGTAVNVMLSHKTRVRPIDFANHNHIHSLVKSGGRVFRYTEKYMHAKVAWNNHGHVLIGSANLENRSLQNNFECCVLLRDKGLAATLQRVFETDAQLSNQQTLEMFRNRLAPTNALSYACNLVSPWL
ncbi:MAG: hypothetical protein IMY76_03940 [Chloroflexi bacterium]|nr:hypothetical protein [Chloroflexota bacterium]